MSSLKLKLSLTAAAVLLAGCSLPSDGPTEETIMQRQVEAHENVQIQLSNRVSALEQELQGVEGKIEDGEEGVFKVCRNLDGEHRDDHDDELRDARDASG